MAPAPRLARAGATSLGLRAPRPRPHHRLRRAARTHNSSVGNGNGNGKGNGRAAEAGPSSSADTPLSLSLAGSGKRDGVMRAWLEQLRVNGGLIRVPAPSSAVGKEHVFNKADWEQHKDTGRYLRHIVTMTKSRTVAALLAPTTFCLAETAAVAAYSTLHPASLPDLPPVGQEFFNLTSGALALLLVFRTDASYNRWDEARQQWGEIIFNGRNLVRCGLDAFSEPEQQAFACQLVKWTVAFSTMLKLHLREDTKQPAIERELGAWLSAADVALLAAARHKPNAALQVLSRIARQAPPDERGRLEQGCAAFSEALGRCERISRVPIPLSYTRHTSRFLIAWLLLLPLGCWSAMHWNALLFAPLTVFLLFGVDQIGVDLENPFSVLPLDVLSNKLKLDAADMMALSEDVGLLVSNAATAQSLAPAAVDAAMAAAAAARAREPPAMGPGW